MNAVTNQSTVEGLPTEVLDLVRMPKTEAHDRIVSGLQYAVVIATLDAIPLQRNVVASLLSVPIRTMQRWASKRDQKLDAAQGSRFYRLMRVFDDGIVAFGTREATMDWLHEKQPALDYRRPIDLMNSDPGASTVEQLLGRIRYGVYT